MRRSLFLGAMGALILLDVEASAQEPPPQEPPPPPGVHVTPPAEEGGEAPAIPAPSAPSAFEAPAEAPPPPPRHKGFVLESTLGAAGFLGEFRRVAPPGWWLHTQFGYEITRWFMLFAEGELMFTDTSAAHDPSKVRAFPIFGFGAGGRLTIHPTERFAFFVQGSIDALKADVPKNALAVIGFRDAESLNPSFGGRLGLEWYQIDRHLALGATGGVRQATGFAKFSGGGDNALLWDAGLSLRYTF